jgi:hypothetical protein
LTPHPVALTDEKPRRIPKRRAIEGSEIYMGPVRHYICERIPLDAEPRIAMVKYLVVAGHDL